MMPNTNPNTTDSDTRKTLADGFPVITNWGDPILYSCQKNFILGIGDVNTHADRDLPGSSLLAGAARGAMPARTILSEYHAASSPSGAAPIFRASSLRSTGTTTMGRWRASTMSAWRGTCRT